MQDVTRRWLAPPGQTLSPRAILEEIARLCTDYRISIVYSDQYQLESLQEIAREFKLIIQGVPFTAKSKAQMYGNLQQMFMQGTIRILDDAETIKELKALERTMTSDSVKISAPPGMNDDMASVLCLAMSQAQLFLSRPPEVRPTDDEPTPYQRVMAQLEAKRPQTTVWD